MSTHPLHIMFELLAPLSPTRDEQAVLLHAREGKSLSVPPQTIQSFRQMFEESSRFSASEKWLSFRTHVISAVFPPFIIAPATRALLDYEQSALGMLAVTATISASFGKQTIRDADAKVAQQKIIYDRRVESYLRQMNNYASHYARVNYVDEMDTAVRAGQNLSMRDLAKLVNIHNDYFVSACEKLEITVLQAKLMIAIQNKEIESFVIPHSSAAGPNSVIPDEYLSTILRAQFGKVTLIDQPNELPVEDKAQDTSVLQNPVVEQPKNAPSILTVGNFLSAVYRFYAEGLPGNLRLFQRPKADNHLPTQTRNFTVDFLKSTPDLAERIERFEQKLDLPALARTL